MTGTLPAAQHSPRRRPVTTRLDIVCFGQQNWDVTWTSKQQHCTRLARRGHRVLYVDPHPVEHPGSMRASLRALAPVALRSGLRTVDERLLLHTYHHAPLLRWRLNTFRRPMVLRALVRRLGFHAPVVLAFHPHAPGLIEALRPHAIFYYAVDEMSAFGNRPEEERRAIREAEEALLRRSTAAFAVSPRLVERFRRMQPRTLLLENGVDPDYFSPDRLRSLSSLPEVASLPAPRLGLIGQIDERIDQALLLGLARAHPEWSIVLAGRVKTGVDVSALVAEPNVHLIGFQPHERLPQLLRDLQVCLVPYRRTLLTESCNPYKIFEYVAAGRPVISTPLDGIVTCRPVVSLAEGPEAFVAAAEAALRDGDRDVDRRLEIARASTWDRRTDVLESEMLAALEARG